jgi:hypothetical protein
MTTFVRTLLAGIAVLAATALAVPVAGLAQSNAELCTDHQRGVVNCGPGNDRQVAGGGEKVLTTTA